MEFFRIRKRHPFMRHALTFNVISAHLPARRIFLFSRGLHLSVEFTGGTLIELNHRKRRIEKVRDALGTAGYTDLSVQNFGSSQDVLIRLPLKAEQNTAKIGEAIVAQALAVEAIRCHPASRRVCRPAGRQGTGGTVLWRCCW